MKDCFLKKSNTNQEGGYWKIKATPINPIGCMWVIVDQQGKYMYRDLPSPSRSARPQARYGDTSSAMSSSSQWLASHSESQAHQFPNKQAPLSTCSNMSVGRPILRIQAKHSTPGTTVPGLHSSRSEKHTYSYYRFRLRTMMGNLGVFLGGSRRRLERQPITRWWSPSASVFSVVGSSSFLLERAHIAGSAPWSLDLDEQHACNVTWAFKGPHCFINGWQCDMSRAVRIEK
jgi:hypothetical protein